MILLNAKAAVDRGEKSRSGRRGGAGEPVVAALLVGLSSLASSSLRDKEGSLTKEAGSVGSQFSRDSLPLLLLLLLSLTSSSSL